MVFNAIMRSIGDGLICIGYPIYIALIIIIAIYMIIHMCSPLIVKLIGDIGIENQCNKIKINKSEEKNDNT